MKKKAILIISIIILACLIFYAYPAWKFLIKPNTVGGFYEPITNTLYCNDELYCWHEKGHKLDDEKGWVSNTKEYREALDIYLESYHGKKVKELIDWKSTINLQRKVYMFFSYYKEMYATIYSVYGGRVEWMPEYLQEFYTE